MQQRTCILPVLLLTGTIGHAQRPFVGDSTPAWEEVIGRFRALDERHASAKLIEIGRDDDGSPIHLFVLSDGGGLTPDSIRASGKRLLWVTNGIHPGEPDGIDASLMLAKALLEDEGQHALLRNTAVCIVPVYNVGGARQRNGTTRVNQNGPLEHGFRANARNLDLNRDFIKADARNTRDMIAVLDRWDPDIYFETHVSNGADHRYVMELLTSHPDRLDPSLRDYVEGTLKPGLYARMEDLGIAMCPYFETVKDHPEQGLEGFLDGPRYSTGHAALRQRIGVLSESHMLKPYAERVNATFQLMLATLAVMDLEGGKLQAAREQAKRSTASTAAFGFNFMLDTARVERLPWKGYRAGYKPSQVSGLHRLWYDRGQPTDTVAPWRDHFIPAFTISKPNAYLVPQAWHEVIERLRLEGVPMETVPVRRSVQAEVQRVVDLRTVGMAYEGRYLHHGITTSMSLEVGVAEAEDVLVPMGHPTDRLVMEVLEPRASDSFFAWGFFDGILQRKEWFSDYVFEDVAAELLRKDPKLREALEKHRAADPAFAADAAAQLRFVYERSPHAEPGYRRYPVLRVVKPRE